MSGSAGEVLSGSGTAHGPAIRRVVRRIQDILVVGNVSDNPFALDMSHFFGQRTDISDIISLKTFENTEFCPRFITTLPENGGDVGKIGHSLEGKAVILVSVSTQYYSRNDIAYRNLLVAKAAKDNGADWVLLVEPDLFYSAQDRGPRFEQGKTAFNRDNADLYKFNGQPFSCEIYAKLLKLAGVDEVMTVHIHSASVQAVYRDTFGPHFTNLLPDKLFARYIRESGIADLNKLVLCAPDKGALDFVRQTHAALGMDKVPIIIMNKVRSGERKVSTQVSPDSPYPLEYIRDKDVIVIDDMVRTGHTILNCCSLLKDQKPNRVIFLVTHFHSSPEARENLSSPVVDEIITTHTIPNILNRDSQGRLRKKIAVLKLSRWIAHHLRVRFKLAEGELEGKWYQEDISSKNPRSPLYREYLPAGAG